jgi:ATP-dependent RNA helicase SUPV3L1/SUV3
MPVTFSPPVDRDLRARGAGVTAVLGPTNTGKTHLAIERMLAHSSGIIGLPLRLLAREVYNKVVERAGADAVALITGEEKIKPANPRFWVSTVEAMPRDIEVAFLAVDEIQLAADLERGHVFTDRILHRRGREETLVLGAATVRPLVERLLPGAHVLSRPRLSRLSFAGERKITRLQPRSAIVAFSAEEVYAIAELIRRQRGGAAVVLGALSPRTRNAQVALYQSGDVDYLVATDAIGMGLNLDVEHVAFASDRKFDGYQFRRLTPAEFAQIAGRAGRATRDGTFGTTGRCPPFEKELVEALESHNFEPIKVFQWRNTDLDYSSLGALAASLAQAPSEPGLTRAPIAEDIQVLEHAARDDDVRALANTPHAVERLWEVCQVPDYRKISPAAHAELVTTLYGFLMRRGTIPADWFSRQVALADRTDGDIDTISTRIAHIRTWTFAANRPDWLADPEHWQGVTRAVEDKLSDALHERLTERFVDRRTSVLMRRLRENTMLETEITKSGDVLVEGHPIGRLVGFQFAADPAAGGPEARTLRGAAQKALAGEIEQRAVRLASAPDGHFVLASDDTVRWTGEPVAKLLVGEDTLRPRLRLIADEHLTGAAREAVQARLELWLKGHVERLLGPLFALANAEDVTGIARGIAFQIVEALGVLERHKVSEEIRSLDQPARALLRKYGVRIGAFHLYVPALLKPAPRALAAQLWALKHAQPENRGIDVVRQLAASGRTSVPLDKEVPKHLYRIAGYRVCGERAVRIDILERLADLIRPALAWRPGVPGERPPGAVDGTAFVVTPAMTSLIGAAGEDFRSVLRALGYRMEHRPRTVDSASPDCGQPAASAPADTREARIPDLTTVEDDPPGSSPDRVIALSGAAPSSLHVQTFENGAGPPSNPVDEAKVASPSAPTPAAILDSSGQSDLIEVWRPGGRRERAARRHRRARDGQRADHRASREAELGSVRSKPSPAATTKTAPADHGESLSDRPARRRPRAAGEPIVERKGLEHRRRERGGERSDRLFATSEPPRRDRREAVPDPNSPFAKLAALKEQLEANARDRR